MKHMNFCILSVSMFLLSVAGYAQTADEIIEKYVNAIGGKETLGKINSLYMENSIEVMGNEGPSTTVILNGKGAKSVSDIMGQKMVQCYTDKGGWVVNPMAGSSDPVEMPADQYNSGKSQIYITDPIVDYTSKGYKAEYVGTEKIGNVDAHKIKLVSAENITITYFIDPSTNYVIKMTMAGNMMGQAMEVVTTPTDYRKTDQGLVLPYITEVNYGGQFSLVLKIKKLEFNKPVDPVIFEKGNMSL